MKVLQQIIYLGMAMDEALILERILKINLLTQMCLLTKKGIWNLVPVGFLDRCNFILLVQPSCLYYYFFEDYVFWENPVGNMKYEVLQRRQHIDRLVTFFVFSNYNNTYFLPMAFCYKVEMGNICSNH